MMVYTSNIATNIATVNSMVGGGEATMVMVIPMVPVFALFVALIVYYAKK